MKWKEQMLHLRAYQPGKSIEEVKREYNLNNIVKLASNENPYGYSPMVDTALNNFGDSFRFYPDGSAQTLREKTAGFLDVDQNQLIFTNGTDELVQIVSRALLEPGKNTVMPTPTFPQYKHNAVIEGAEVREVPVVEGRHDLSKMLAAIDDETAIVWLCSPNNPTGIYMPQTELRTFMDSVPSDVLVVLDEAYYEYVDDPDDSLALIDVYPNLLITRTFSKGYGLASFRVGYGISTAENISRLEPARPPFNTNALGQLAAAAALDDPDFVAESRQANAEEKEKYYQFCQRHGLSYFPTQGNFILIDLQCDGDFAAEFLLRRGLIVRSGAVLGFPTCARITIGTKDQNEQVRHAIDELKQHVAAQPQGDLA
ncbi:Histidinol-phosphate transaminase [Lentibacillus sp. JNUCC-1]|uniref:histidinol-phosphate transaminase n=1 Tax=Lentibacillus sp. JNUCC-1 TaxID=2654513 RepID=UPI0012E94D85|nr:histidinol-phosphate transaminase [Lentibacillus sp. JNUCC-1]MUV37846.1 Histidinol-phosphate transaminase [Lentibacillus sp. JNUCC-1]